MPVITVRIKYHLFFPILLRAARQCSCIDVMTSALQCTGTTFVLIVLIRSQRSFASWVILIGRAKTDESITGNITASFCIFLLANLAWPSYVVLHDRLAIKCFLSRPWITDMSTMFTHTTRAWRHPRNCTVDDALASPIHAIPNLQQALLQTVSVLHPKNIS